MIQAGATKMGGLNTMALRISKDALTMNKLMCRLTLLLALFGWSLLASAAPVLSADGSMLSGLDVNGTLYDIEFIDGVVSEVFPIDQVLAPGWYDLAGSVTAALYNALADIGLSDNEAIRGCKDNPGIPGFIGPNICLIVTPDKLDSVDVWGADNLVVVNSTGTYYTPPPYGAGISGYADTADPSLDYLTLARFSQRDASIPMPGSLLLILSGLLLIALRSRHIDMSHFRRIRSLNTFG